jgi:hypothetical protein
MNKHDSRTQYLCSLNVLKSSPYVTRVQQFCSLYFHDFFGSQYHFYGTFYLGYVRAWLQWNFVIIPSFYPSTSPFYLQLSYFDPSSFPSFDQSFFSILCSIYLSKISYEPARSIFFNSLSPMSLNWFLKWDTWFPKYLHS